MYPTARGRVCPACGEPVGECVCRQPQAAAIPPGDGIVRVSRQTKGRKGKGVTRISGVALAENALHNLARQLKRRCGAGGTLRDRVIEIQGDHRDVLVEELRKQGYTVKRTGG
ncbi:MAG TPA: translation initiation factor Sui1 [Sedimentisphaerales bacterium]|nr:translation initiation factor Sui1 [Sedimentisphaerales bacterium]HRS09848.1 translation initiation factor Sui1 [Sedimentisphaerales bacterium]HRV46502.1 translation initiation factor Sui1 [Sedimentisphaerales bacterium]